MRNAVIVDAVRTPSGRGKPGGALSGVHPVDLAAGVLSAVLDRNGLESRQIDDVLIGCVSQIGDQAMNVARQAVLAARFDETVPATTIDRQCGSSQQAAHFAAQGVIAGAYDVVIAAGVESMSRVPLGSSRTGGSRSALLERRYPEGLVNQGVSAELIAQKWGLSRDVLDAYSAESHRRAADAASRGMFDSQLLAVQTEGGEVTVDETVRAGTTMAGLEGLSPAFRTRWAQHNIRLHHGGVKRFHHPEVGNLELAYRTLPLSTSDQEAHILTAYTAQPGSPSEDRLKLLASWAASHNSTNTSA